jgi:hypothetical protein
MSYHQYTSLLIAEDWDWTTLAFHGGELTGPSVIIEQCQRCKLVRVVSYKDDAHRDITRYYVDGLGTLVEPDCNRLSDQQLVETLSRTVG